MAFAVVLTVLLFTLSGTGKVINAKVSLEQRDALSVPPGLWRTIGALELLGVLGVVGAWLGVVPNWLGQAAAAGFVLLLLGAIATRLRARSPVGGHAADGCRGDRAVGDDAGRAARPLKRLQCRAHPDHLAA